MAKRDWETDGTYHGTKVYCPVNAYGDCPYCDQENICHIEQPDENCDDFYDVFGTMEEWENLG